jgi:uridine kinase
MQTSIRSLIAYRNPRVGHVTFVAIDGRGGSGKSTLAEFLSKKLSAQIIHTDDFASWDNLLNWWPKIIAEVFEPIQNGVEKLRYTRSSWSPTHKPDPVINQQITNIMLLEGASSSRREFKDFLSISIFVDTPREDCLERGIARDVAAGAAPEKIRIQWEEWAKEEDGYLTRDNPKESADVVLDGTKPWEEQLSF